MFALDNGLDVVIEGILQSESYDETLERHQTKALAAEVSEADVASWYRSADRVAALDESVFDATVSAADALRQVLADVG